MHFVFTGALSFLYSDPSFPISQYKLFSFICMAWEETPWNLTWVNKCIHLEMTLSFLFHWPKNTKGVGKLDDL